MPNKGKSNGEGQRKNYYMAGDHCRKGKGIYFQPSSPFALSLN
jgi:hypothetical protein